MNEGRGRVKRASLRYHWEDSVWIAHLGNVQRVRHSSRLRDSSIQGMRDGKHQL